MAIRAEVSDVSSATCAGCNGSKGAPIACTVAVGEDIGFSICQECGRDLANAIGFMCMRDGGWSKLEPRRKKLK